MVMRSALLFATILLFAIVPFSNTATASGLDENSGITITASFDNSTEMTTLNITMPVTNNATLLDELKDAKFSISRMVSGEYPVVLEIASELQFCTQSTSNSDCSGATFQIEYFSYPFDSGNYDYQYLLGFGDGYIMSNTLKENVSWIMAVDNLTGTYSSDVTTLSWDYIDQDFPMNHSVMIYSHDSPATRANWNSLPKTIVSSSVAAGTTSFEINHSGEQVEREIYYSVTLLFETSEDTRFIGNNTLSQPVTEDNTAPLFIGELTASFDYNTSTTILDWEEGVDDEGHSINIYRHDGTLEAIDPSKLIATVDASDTFIQLPIEMGEHRQSWYAITLQDSEGNEILELTESSPVSNSVIETTISTSTVTGIVADSFGDGTVVISWDDNTQNPEATARIWRSINGPIESFENIEEIGNTNVSAEQFAHNPLDYQDQVWYAVTIDASWGIEDNPWHDDRLFLGVNSMDSPVRETDEEPEGVTTNFTSLVLTTTGFRANISDGSMIFLGQMYEGDLILISTSSIVTNISCHDITGEGSLISTNYDWALSLNSNQSAEKCLGTIIDGEDEISFTLTWNYLGTVATNDTAGNDDDGDDDDGGDVDDDHRDGSKGKSESKENIAGVILAIVLLALLVYLLVMMKAPEYGEEE